MIIAGEQLDQYALKFLPIFEQPKVEPTELKFCTNFQVVRMLLPLLLVIVLSCLSHEVHIILIKEQYGY